MDLTDIKQLSVSMPKVYLGEKQRLLNYKGKIKNTIGNEITSELLPFKPTMIKQLKRHGYDTNYMPFNLVVPLYFNEFVSNKNNEKNYYEPINCYEFADNPIFKFSVNDNVNGEVLSFKNRSYFTQVNNIVDSIINSFRAAKLKKESLITSGSDNFDIAMTKDELIQARAADHIEKELENRMNESRAVTVKDLKLIIYIALGIWLLWYLIIYKDEQNYIRK